MSRLTNKTAIIAEKQQVCRSGCRYLRLLDEQFAQCDLCYFKVSINVNNIFSNNVEVKM